MTSIVRRIPFKPIAATLLALSFSGSGTSQSVQGHAPARPGTLIELRIAAARPGSVVTIPPGSYGPVRLFNIRRDPAIEVRLSGVTVAGLYIRNSAGLTLVGGTVDPNNKERVAVDALSVDNLTLRDMTATRALRGFTVGRGRNIQLINNEAHNLRSDGINIAAVQNVLVEGNFCHDFTPIKAIRDEKGNLIKDGDHPDCIQSWSRPTEMANTNIIVRANRMEGDMQGIFFGSGGNDGGYDRVQIIGNVVNVGAPNGIALGDGRDSRVMGNRVSSMPGYAFPNGEAVRTSIVISRPERTMACGNYVEDFPDSPPARRCAKP